MFCKEERSGAKLEAPLTTGRFPRSPAGAFMIIYTQLIIGMMINDHHDKTVTILIQLRLMTITIKHMTYNYHYQLYIIIINRRNGNHKSV